MMHHEMHYYGANEVAARVKTVNRAGNDGQWRHEGWLKAGTVIA
jgi:hypothetical protein